MSTPDPRLLETMAQEIASLPADDPLRRALERSGHAAGLDLDALSGEAAELSRALADIDVPDLGPTLSRIPDWATPSSRNPWRPLALVFAAAAAVFAALWLVPRAAPPDAAMAPAAIAAELAPTRLVAVKFWHQTCPACREIDPRYSQVRKQFEAEPVLFVTFDMSTERSRSQSKMLAERLGLADLYEQNFGGTGFVVLVDADSRLEVARLTTQHGTDAMKQILTDNLNEPQS